jgi:hypothetical protein
VCPFSEAIAVYPLILFFGFQVVLTNQVTTKISNDSTTAQLAPALGLSFIFMWLATVSLLIVTVPK